MKKNLLLILVMVFVGLGYTSAQFNGAKGEYKPDNSSPVVVQSNPKDVLLINENMDDITLLEAAGWNIQNLSNPVGTTTWFQGNTTVFTQYEGAGYIGVNFNSTAGVGTISNWLLTPEISMKNGDVFSFWTRRTTSAYPDRLQVRMSTNGSSTNVGTTESSVGDFTTLLLDINENLGSDYPTTWTEYQITISGVTGTVSGRLAFRYYVTNGGPSGANSDYIGIDLVQYNQVTAATDYNVTFSVVGDPANGILEASVTGNPITSPATVGVGSNVDFVATPDAGYQVKEWVLNSGVVAGNTTNLYTLENLSADATVTVEFELIPVYNVTFNVDITDSIASGWFDPAVDSLFMAGNIFVPTWQTPGSDLQTLMLDPEEDGIYTLALADIAAGTYAYKYFKATTVAPTWDNGEWAGDPNRAVTVVDVDLVVNDVFGDINPAVNDISKDIRVYPNPSNGNFNINVNQSMKLEVFDISGKLITAQNVNGISSLQLKNTGLYFLRFTGNEGSFVQKVVVK
jgi:hypothetical protein